MNLFSILVSGGWLMIPIALSSIIVLALGVGRFLVLRRERQELAKFVEKWRAASAGTDPSNYRAASRMGPRVTALMAKVFEDNKPGRSEMTEAVEAVGRQRLYELEKGLGTLATLAAATPLLGFLGTVTGMIRAFMQIQKLGGNVNANVLAGGIWEALVTTAAGLAVGIIALIVHNYLSSLVSTSARLIEQNAGITLRLLGSEDET